MIPMNIFVLHLDLFNFIQTLSLPCETCLSVHSLAIVSSSTKFPPFLQLHGTADPSYYHASVLEGAAYLYKNLLHSPHVMDS